MSLDPAFVRAAHRLKLKRLRPDGASDWTVAEPKVLGARLIMVGLALFFVILGAINLDLGPAEARLGLAAGEKLGPLGQVFGYWAPDLWPAQVIPSLVLGQPGGVRTSQFGSRTLAGRIGGNHRRMDDRAKHGQGAWAARWCSFWDLLVRQPGADRSIGGNRPGPDHGIGHAGVDRPADHAWLGPGCRTVGGPGVSGGRLASPGRDRPGDHRHRQNDRQILARTAFAAAGHGDSLVFLDSLGFLRRGLGGRAHASFDAKASLDARACKWSPSGFPGVRSPSCC